MNKLRNLRCFQHVNWEPDRRELLRFAIAMLAGFTVIGLLFGLRAHDVARIALRFIGIGLALGLGGLLPGIGRFVYLAVYLPASVVGYVVSHVLLTVMFFLVFTPLALLLRLMGRDLLELKPPADASTWKQRATRPDSRRYYRQF